MLKDQQKSYFLAVLGLAFFNSVLVVTLSLLSGLLFNDLAHEQMTPIALLMVFLLTCLVLLSLLYYQLINQTRKQKFFLLMSKTYEHLASLSASSMAKINHEQILTSINELKQSFASFFDKLPVIANAILLSLSLLLITFIYSWLLAFYLLLALFLTWLLFWWIAYHLQASLLKYTDAQQEVSLMLTQIESAMQDIFTLNKSQPIIDKLNFFIKQSLLARQKYNIIKQWQRFCYFLYPFILLIIFLMQQNNPLKLWQLVITCFWLLVFVPLIMRSFLIIPIQPKLNDTLLGLSLELKGRRVKPINIEGKIELDNVSFFYENDARLIIKDYSLSINAGEFVGIIGPSGSGKSTLLKLLMANVYPTAGQVLFDGQDERSLDLIALRQYFGVVHQHNSLIPASILENILAGRAISIRALQHLIYSHSIFESLLELPLGLNTFVATGAKNLSRLQICLILILRALAHKPKILFLDEALLGMGKTDHKHALEFLTILPMTRVMVSHDAGIKSYCHRMIDFS